MKLTICIEYGYDEELPDITVEQVKKALQKFIVPSRSLHVYEAVEHSVQRTAEPLCQVCLMPLSEHVFECEVPQTRRR